MTRTRILLALWLAAFLHPAQAQTTTVSGEVIDTTPDCYRGTAIFLPDAASQQACVDAAAADALSRKASANYSARTNSTFTVTYTPPAPPPDVRTWVRLGPEKTSGGVIQSYTLAAPAQVRFGAGDKWALKAMPAGRFSCSTSTFGDPSPGVVKVCDREETGPVVVPPVEPPVVVPPSIGGVPKREDFDGYPTSGPIVARAGQVIEKLRISSPSGPCLIVAVPNVTVRDVLIGPCGPGEPGKGLDVRAGASNVTVERSYIEDISTALYANGAAHPIIFDRNYVTKVRGPMPRGQMVQLNNVKGGTGKSRVTCNVGDVQGQPNIWRNVEDWLNFYSTGGVEVAYNRLRGGGYQGYNGNPPSGTAVLFGDAAGGTDAWVHDNRFVGMTNVGIGVAGGVGARIERNWIHMDARLSENYTNVGIYVAKYSSGACSGHSVTENRVFVRKADGSLNPYFFDTGSCGAVAQQGNVWNDTTLDPVAMFSTVPAECQ